LGLRIFLTLVGAALGVFDLFFGFLTWPEKKLRIQIFILADETATSVVKKEELTPAIDYATKIFKERLNVKLLPFASDWVEYIKKSAPPAALNVDCGFFISPFQEFGEAGDFFAHHLAGWNAAPVSGRFPVTVFIVADVGGPHKTGCSMGPFTDYVLVDRAAISATNVMGAVTIPNPSTMAHEIGHACNLPHWWWPSNLMYGDTSTRTGDELKWFQKNLFRCSRHVLYW
jgi:hypothetical protein